MATEVSKAVEQKLRAKAKEADNKARKLRTEYIRNPWLIAKVCAQVHKDNLWKYMGTTYDSMDSWFTDIRVSRSTGRRGIRLYTNGTQWVPEKELFRMSLEAAEWLLKLPEKDRKNPDIWKKAQTMIEEEFMQLVNERRKSNGESPEDGRITLKLRLYAGQADVIKAALERFCEDNGLGDDQGRALELICADVLASSKEGKTFMAKLGERITGAAFEMSQLKSVVQGIRDQFGAKTNKSGDEILLYVSQQLDPLEDGILKAVTGLAEATKNMASKQPKGQQPLAMQAAAASAAAGTTSKAVN